MSHLALLPILVPLLGGAASLFVEHRRVGTVLKRSIAWVFMLATLAASVALLARAADGSVTVYLLGDWPARIGIALMVDRLSALMLVATSLLAAACLLHACSGWDRRALHFHALFQFQLVGLNGTFLTGDIFNLFVFFEVMLIASYGLLLSGGRGVRITAGLHYVVFNVVASSLFLLALGLIYGLLGTLNMAAIAERVALLPARDLALAQAAFGLLLVVFCSKAALLPLYLWLPETYTRAPAAVAALFVVMSKVGIYAVLRVWSLVLGETAGPLEGLGWDWMLVLAVGLLAMAALGVLAATRMRMIVAYLVLVSAATLFIAFGLRQPGTIAAGLYYLVQSTFVAAALFMIADLVRRGRGDASSDLREIHAPPPVRRLAGIMFFVAAITVAGLPPFSGFIGKAALLAAVPAAHTGWVWTAVLLSSLMVIIGLARAGSRVFWRSSAGSTMEAPEEPEPVPRTLQAMRRTETAATLLLLAYGVAMTLAAAPAMDYALATAEQLLDAPATIEQLRGAMPGWRNP